MFKSKLLLITLLSVIFYFVSASRLSRSDGVLYFPGQPIRTSPTSVPVNPQQFVANLSRCAQNNQTFCTKNDDYPLEYVKTLLREHATRFADVVTDVESNDITDRLEDFDDDKDEFMCSSYEKVIYPKAGKTQDGKEYYIFNTNDYKQGVRVSMCQNAGLPCKMTENFPNGVKTECKQQFVYRELLSLSSDGKPTKDHFEFPACCSCVLHRS